MEIKELNKRPDLNQNEKVFEAYSQFEKLLTELRTRELSENTVDFINEKILLVNSILGSEKQWDKEIKTTPIRIVRFMEKKDKLVTKNHYRNTWLAAGMALFGIPFGAVLGLALGNMAFLAIGLPIGMAMGIAVGTRMDNKALEEGRQIDLEIKP